MDRTQELAKLREELFKLRYEIAINNRQPELKRELEDKAKVIHSKMAKLLWEIKKNAL